MTRRQIEHSGGRSSDRPSPKAAPAEENLRETFQSIVIAFVLAFVFRAYVVEAFVIPTGSMAPTLLGMHVDVTCDQCGHAFVVDPPVEAHAQGAVSGSRSPVCPMCHHQVTMPAGVRVRSGDRILVHKFIYSVSEPRRWDVVVFKDPQEPDRNFIKRLVGLPGEDLWLIDGNVYVRPHAGESSDGGREDWRIARKSDRPDVQRALWQPVYHSRYIPLDGGRGRRHNPWRTPWRVDDNAQAWSIDGLRSYRHDDEAPGRIRFDFSRARAGLPDFYVYNQFRIGGAEPFRNEPIEDIRLAATFEPDETGLTVVMGTTTRLDHSDANAPMQPVFARIDATGEATLETIDPDGKRRELARTAMRPLPAGAATSVELWVVDQEISLWVNGRRTLQWRYHLPIQTVIDRPAPRAYPTPWIEVAGAPVTLHNVEVDRDIYYSGRQPGSSIAGRGALVKDFDGEHIGEPVAILPDRFFCLGDNSPLSSDSRYWTEVDPWIVSRMFDDGEMAMGVVPRELMMGRAFFVYYPAPLGLGDTRAGFIPNFGAMRFIR